MLQLDELRLAIDGIKSNLKDLAEAIGLSKIVAEIQVLEQKSTAPDFWNDMENSHKVLQKISTLKNKQQKYLRLMSLYEDTNVLIDLVGEAYDDSLLEEIDSNVNVIQNEIEAQRLETLLNGEYDYRNAILTFHAGAGGTEAQDWVEMLYRMYYRWGERHNFKVKTLDYLDGEEAGLKSVSILVEGLNAYGYLKSEAGVHRLVRVSPFDSS